MGVARVEGASQGLERDLVVDGRTRVARVDDEQFLAVLKLRELQNRLPGNPLERLRHILGLRRADRPGRGNEEEPPLHTAVAQLLLDEVAVSRNVNDDQHFGDVFALAAFLGAFGNGFLDLPLDLFEAFVDLLLRDLLVEEGRHACLEVVLRRGPLRVLERFPQSRHVRWE